MPLLKTWLKVLLAFLLLLMLCKDLIWIIVVLRFGIGVHHSNINNTIHSVGPKATHKNVCTVVVNK
jgi:hypothetical protein